MRLRSVNDDEGRELADAAAALFGLSEEETPNARELAPVAAAGGHKA